MPLSTIFILNWIPLFTRPPTVEILLDAIRYRQQHLGWRIYGWVVLENHIHMIVHTNRLQPELAAFKSYTARRLIDYLTEHRVRRIQEILSDLHIDCDLCGSLLSNAESTLNDR